MTDAKADSEYLKSEEIGGVIAKAMAHTYRAQPQNPIDYFAKWLLNYSQVQKNQLLIEEKMLNIKELKEKREFELKEKQDAIEAKRLKRQQVEKQIEEFNVRVMQSTDLADNLQELVDHLKTHTNSTCVYVGKVVKPYAKIKEGDNDQAHIDPNAVN